MTRSLQVLLVFLFFGGLLVWYLFFRPQHYNVKELQNRPGTAYWHLSTGSTIAYTHLAGKGNKKKEPVIYLHGGPGAGITDKEINTLSALTEDGYDVYLYDQIGCGHSGRLANINEYTATRHCKDLEAIIDRIGSDKVILLAQSWGSILSLLYLTIHPDRVEKLVVTAPAPIQPANKSLGNRRPPDSIRLRSPYVSPALEHKKKAGWRTRMMFYAARKFGKKLVPDAEADRLATDLTNEINLSMVCDTANAVVAEGTEGMYVNIITSMSLGKLQDQRAALQKISVPVLVMKAQCDNQPWGYATEYAEVLQNSRLVLVENAGHNIFLEQPATFITLIRNFLLE